MNFLVFFETVINDIFGFRNDINKISEGDSVSRAINWIKNAQDITGNGGISAFYDLFTGWANSYPEVTGYTIPTMIEYNSMINDKDLSIRLVFMGEWLLNVQLDNGGYPAGVVGNKVIPSVFNTAQVIEGLIALYKNTSDNRYILSARKAADWIIKNQDNNRGFWVKFNYLEMARTYDARVAMILIELGRLCNNFVYIESGIRNLDWVLQQQKRNGWFENCDNSMQFNHIPLTHTIGYAVEGLLKSGIMMNQESYIKAAQKTLEALLKRFEVDFCLMGRYDCKWKSAVKYMCLTGCAQIALCWFVLSDYSNDLRYANAALKMNDFLRSQQGTSSLCAGINGAIKGSVPVWGRYQPFKFLSWAVKYFVDSLLFEKKILEKCKKELINLYEFSSNHK